MSSFSCTISLPQLTTTPSDDVSNALHAMSSQWADVQNLVDVLIEHGWSARLREEELENGYITMLQSFPSLEQAQSHLDELARNKPKYTAALQEMLVTPDLEQFEAAGLEDTTDADVMHWLETPLPELFEDLEAKDPISATKFIEVHTALYGEDVPYVLSALEEELFGHVDRIDELIELSDELRKALFVALGHPELTVHLEAQPDPDVFGM